MYAKYPNCIKTLGRISLILLLLALLPTQFIEAGMKDKAFVLVIDPGHGGRDTGCIGTVLKVKEKDVNLSVAQLVGDYINKNHPDVKIIYTRKTDKFIVLDNRAQIANNAKADLFISIHANSVKPNNKPFGAETYTLGLARTEENLEVAKRENAVIYFEDDYKQKYEGFDPNSSESYIIFEFIQNKYVEQSVFLASAIQTQFKSTSQRKDRGVRQSGFLVLRATSMPSVLIELGYLSNKEEEAFLNTKAGQQKLARSISDAFTQYKNEHDRKSGIISHPANPSTPIEETADFDESRSVETVSPQPERENVSSKSNNTEKSTNVSNIIYKVQILTSDKKLSKNSPLLKGYKADVYYEKGLYKYTYGETSDWDEISRLQKKLRKQFKDAFVITYRNGVKVTK